MPLTDTAIRQTKPLEKPVKLADGAGLYLLLNPNGSRYWRMKYRFGGKEKLLSLGVYPEISLATARQRREEARRLLTDGVDPGAVRQEAKRITAVNAVGSFEHVAREWIVKQANRWSPGHAERVLVSLQREVFPYLGTRPLNAITAGELLAVMRGIEARGIHETAMRVLQRCSCVFRFGVITGMCERNPAADLRGALTPPKTTHYAALSAEELPEFLNKLDNYEGHFQTQCALKLLLLTFVRTGELRAAQWSEFDLDTDTPTWRIPAERMKMRKEHIVPLSRQVVEVLRQMQALTGHGGLVFPSQTNYHKPMSENTVLYALYRMGYHSRATGHGFRACASTILNEQGWRSDVIERQLAHAERNKVRAAYHRSEYLPERRKMMQAWADYLDSLREGSNVVPLNRKSA